MLYVCKFNVQVMESGTKMPGSIDQGRNQIKFEDMRDARVVFGKETSIGFLPEDGSRKGSERGFMAVDIKVQEGNVTLVFIFLSERDRCRLGVQKIEEDINVFCAGKNWSVSST